MFAHTKMEWSKEITLQFIELYRNHDIIWDPKNKDHFNKILKNDSWSKIAADMSRITSVEISAEQCRKKVVPLLSSFRRERAKYNQSLGSGKGADEIYKSPWFAFESFQFLLNKDTPRKRRCTIQDDFQETDQENPDIEPRGINKQESQGPPLSTTPHRSKKPKKSDLDDKRLDQAFRILQDSAESDESQSFGIFVGKKLKNYTPFTKSAVQHAISNILFHADRGYYEQSTQTQNTYSAPGLHLNQNQSFFVSNPGQPPSTSGILSAVPSPSLGSSTVSSPAYSQISDDFDITDLY